MKTKVLKDILLRIQIDDRRIVTGVFNPKTRGFENFSYKLDGLNIEKTLRIVNVTDDGRIDVSYVFSDDYNVQHIYFPVGGQLTIPDHYGSHDVDIVIETIAREVEIDENDLTLSVRELASEGRYYKKGNLEFEIPAKAGMTFSTSLMKGEQKEVLVKAVSGANVTLEIKGKEYTINPWVCSRIYEQDYDGVISEWFLEVHLSIEEALFVAR
ncbi:MAG: hypothetical protein K5694_00965 [Bacilli bacterium]|nr:hypothetical protein [Bacilli bacterium]